jgi:hypothetical protein
MFGPLTQLSLSLERTTTDSTDFVPATAVNIPPSKSVDRRSRLREMCVNGLFVSFASLDLAKAAMARLAGRGNSDTLDSQH